MSHDLDTTDGITSFVTARQPAWHRLGTVFDTEMTVAEALDAAHLAGWNVRKIPLLGRETVEDVEITGDGVTATTRTVDVTESNWRLAVRDNPITGAVESFGPVGRNFVHVQNEEHGEFLETLLDMSGARFLTTAGALKGGAQVFYCAKLPETMLIGGVDRTDLYITAMNGHDGSMAFGVIASPVRVVCANTQAAAIRSAAQKWTTRHTKGAPSAIAAAREGLDLVHRFDAAFEAEAERMIQEQLTLAEFDKITAGLFDVKAPEDESPRERTYRENRANILHTIWHGDTVANIADTRYAGYNVITEYVDHYAIARGKSEDAQAAGRAYSALLDRGATLKSRAFDAFRVPVAAN